MTPGRLKTVSNPRMEPGNAVSFRVERADGKSLDVSCEPADLANLIQFLFALARHQTAQADPSLGAGAPGQHDLAPVSIDGLGFCQGSSPEETILLVRIGRFDLGLSMTSSELLRLSGEMSQIAQTLSAPGTQKN